MTHFLLLTASIFLLGTSVPADAADGKALYATSCIACHGPKAQGAIPGVPDLAKSKRRPTRRCTGRQYPQRIPIQGLTHGDAAQGRQSQPDGRRREGARGLHAHLGGAVQIAV